jgi:hypothetical protein
MGANRRVVSDEILARLARVGFVRRRDGVAECEVGQVDVVGWLGLPSGRAEDGQFSLYPNVGVRHEGIEPLLRELMPGLRVEKAAATASVNIGVLEDGGTSRGWVFGGVPDDEAAVGGLVAEVQRVGLPFMKRLASDPAGLEDLVDRTHPQRTTMLPLVMLVHGRVADARRVVEETERDLPPRGPYRDFYRAFAERVRAVSGAAEP